MKKLKVTKLFPQHNIDITTPTMGVVDKMSAAVTAFHICKILPLIIVNRFGRFWHLVSIQTQGSFFIEMDFLFHISSSRHLKEDSDTNTTTFFFP